MKAVGLQAQLSEAYKMSDGLHKLVKNSEDFHRPTITTEEGAGGGISGKNGEFSVKFLTFLVLNWRFIIGKFRDFSDFFPENSVVGGKNSLEDGEWGLDHHLMATDIHTGVKSARPGDRFCDTVGIFPADAYRYNYKYFPSPEPPKEVADVGGAKGGVNGSIFRLRW